MTNKTSIKVFCAAEQKDTEHLLDIDGNSELVLTCTDNVGTEESPSICGRFLKFPRGTTPAQLQEYVSAHHTGNRGQVSVESQEAEKAKLLAAFRETESQA